MAADGAIVVFLIGPDEWRRGHQMQTPVWASDDHPPPSMSPKGLRQLIGRRMERDTDGAVRAIVMDREDQGKGESNVEFFERLIEQHRVRVLFAIWPANAKILGLTFELGMWAKDPNRPQLLLFVEEVVMKGTDADGWTLTEEGNRTTYLADVAKSADHVQRWKDVEALIDAVVERASALVL